MSLHADDLFAYAIPVTHARVTTRDALLYALSTGYATRPLDPQQLRYSYGPDPIAALTLANVVAHPGPWMRDAGVNWSGVVHAEQRLIIHREMPLDQDLVCTSRMVSVVDKGAEKGMFASYQRTLTTADAGVVIATIIQTDACRFDGGCGSQGTPPPALLRVPEREADKVVDIVIPPDAALLYRLNGDFNPLHADPAFARSAGFERPILHGLCTLGHAGRVVADWVAQNDGRTLQAIDARFTAVVFPGDRLTVEQWIENAQVRFRVRAPERNSTVIDCGTALLPSAARSGDH
ncbi:MaoC family dehydratase [Pantoea cypripedii]|uniref:Dehydratase n=1 Tax=Pantoea cypripedii TaxID=55209 RepID=A0A1X1ELH2_PANCY|nr:MaoC family dehydratase [Pantoea cypripedii]MBP2200192.1 acyl dehydratase [Pantoea cypripedii]ORM89790.1 dehydratase [Pantoea cypripedii]